MSPYGCSRIGTGSVRVAIDVGSDNFGSEAHERATERHRTEVQIRVYPLTINANERSLISYLVCKKETITILYRSPNYFSTK